MRQLIPAHVIAAVSEVVADAETHATRDRLFMYGGAPGDPPLGSKPAKTQEWLRRVNKDESVQPLDVLGRIIEGYMEADLEHPSFGEYHKKRKDLIERALARAELTYVRGGRVTGVLATPSRTLEDLIRGGDLVALDEEFGPRVCAMAWPRHR